MKRVLLLAMSFVVPLLAACGADDDRAASLVVDDPWVATADSGMTAAFGLLINDSDEDVTVTSVTTDASAAVELHETVQSSGGAMQMQEKDGGFVIPARGEHMLEPGGDHFMLMDLAEAIRPGDEVTFTLTLSSGDKITIAAVAKEFSGADENYAHGDHDHEHDDHDHGDHDHEDHDS